MECLNSNSGELPAPAFSIVSCLGTLHQNNRVVREEGLADLVAALESFVSADDLRHDRPEYERAIDRCFHFLTRGSARERKDAYRAIGLYALTAGPKAETPILDRLLDVDHRPGLVPSSPSDAESAVAAIRCLVAATLACARRPWEAKIPLKALWNVMKETGAANIPRVLAAAMSAWTVVLPTVRDVRGMAPFVLISNLLNTDDPAVRMAAGEALAVCIELDILPRQPQPARWWRDARAESKPGDRPLLESRVAELAFGEKHAQKKEHAEEVSLFRQIDDLLKRNRQQIEDLDKKKNNERPEESDGPCVGKVPKRWVKLVQLNFLKQYIAEGFDAHCNLNLPLFRDTLGLAGAAGEDEVLPAHEKKQLRKYRDRQISLAVKRDRQIKTKQYD